MNDLLDLAVRTRHRRENAVTMSSGHAPAFLCMEPGYYVNSAEPVCLEDRELGHRSQEAVFRLNRFHELKENWDSYGATVPKAMTILEAKQFVIALDRIGVEPYFVSPGPNGEVMLEYRTEGGLEAEVHFHGDGSDHLLVSQGEDFLFDAAFDMNSFLKHVAGRTA